ncbi:hypothetical protein C4D60_Mb07t00870 [Musa balbisiana]|uniref:DUF7866 domain-containing protein n=1 Tax=Musa balbisiana TaxID=52838 RepID=A0A4V4H6B6_MUSBA|nr:hypothetical protein C4D60_Mb07t00870 [Musa balbisiana]
MGNLSVSLFLSLALLLSVFPCEGASHNGTPSNDDYVPVSPVQYRAVAGGILSEPAKVCSDCTCCAGDDKSKCQTMKCCHQIKCNQPGKPFGHCSFTPISCDCNNCE